MPRPTRLSLILLSSATAVCGRTEGAATSDRDCLVSSSDSARAVCTALDTAERLTDVERRVAEFRFDSAGFSILTLPVQPKATDGDLTVRLSKDFKVVGFGPDST